LQQTLKDSEVSANLDENDEEGDGIVFILGKKSNIRQSLNFQDLALMFADWEAIADRGAHDDTLVRSLEQQARLSSSSSAEKTTTTTTTSSSGPKRRGRGSFLYDKSVLYSDQCGSESDLNDEVSSPQSGSKGHMNERENRSATGIQDIHLYLYVLPCSS
jgi:hypothetical protein